MTRERMRASRALVVFLVLSLAIVLIFAKTRRPATPLPSGRLLPATPAALNDQHAKSLLILASTVTTPTTLPTTLPTTQPLAIAPTTHPAIMGPAPDIAVTRPPSPLADAHSKLTTDPSPRGGFSMTSSSPSSRRRRSARSPRPADQGQRAVGLQPPRLPR